MKRGSGSKKKKHASRPSDPRNEEIGSVEIVIEDNQTLGPSKQEILNNFLAETSKIRDSHSEHQANAQRTLAELEGRLKAAAEAGPEEKASLLDQIAKQKELLAKQAEEAVKEKKGMREDIGKLEDDMRRLKDKLAEVEIENQSYQVLADAEKHLREARCAAELAAAKTVNQDLKDHAKRLKKDVEQGEKNKEGSK